METETEVKPNFRWRCFFFGHLKEIFGIKSQSGRCVRCGKKVYQ
jgi:bacterioferritin-associated ferredoxin